MATKDPYGSGGQPTYATGSVTPGMSGAPGPAMHSPETGAKEQVGQVADKAKEQAGQVADKAKEQVGQVADKAREQLRVQADRRVDDASTGLHSTAEAISSVSQQLREKDQTYLADMADRAAGQVDRLSGYLREHDASDMLADVERFARRQPALFLGGAVTLGLLAARFLKTSQPTPEPSRMQGTSGSPGMYGSGDAYRAPTMTARAGMTTPSYTPSVTPSYTPSVTPARPAPATPKASEVPFEDRPDYVAGTWGNTPSTSTPATGTPSTIETPPVTSVPGPGPMREGDRR